jgi:uncharacterized membrane protein YfcA
MDLAIIAFVIAVLLVAAAAQTVAGFGMALIAVPFLVTVLDVKDAVVIVAIASMLNTALVARAIWRHIPRPTVGWMLTGSFVGMPFGLLFLLFAPEDVLRLAVGVAALVMTMAIVGGLRFGGSARTGELAAGAISGALNTSTGMNGPPIVLYLQGRRLPTSEFRGALAAFFFLSGAATLLVFALTGVVTGDALALGAACLPAVLTGNWLGHQLLGRLTEATFRRVVVALLIATALTAIATSLARIAS